MKAIQSLKYAVLAGGLLAAPALALAYHEQPTPWPQEPRPDRPVVLSVVNPIHVPDDCMGTTVDLTFIVDRTGRPCNIRVVTRADPQLEYSVTSALAKWRFAPLQKNGVPVAVRVTMPLHIISET